jgi:predicted type IV restriction endonuclease
MPEEFLPKELGERLAAVAKRLAAIRGACTNEESTKLHLILPVLAALGYDPSNPYEIYPEHAASFDSAVNNRVDFAVLRNGTPIIAIECKKVGADLTCERGQLRGYFNALQPVKLGVLTNGVVWEFFVDSGEPNLMDEEPFLTLDLETVAMGGVPDESLHILAELTKSTFEPAYIAEIAHVQLIKKRLRTALAEELQSPSEEFCRFALQKVGLKNVRRAQIDRHYGGLVKKALTESLILPAAERMLIEGGEASGGRTPQIDSRILTTDRELAIFAYVRRRLAFLVDDELHFGAIDQVQYKDYIGKLVVFFGRERKGWLFDYIEGSDGYDKFTFPAPYGNIITNNILEIDGPLRAVFMSQVRAATSPRRDLARSA